jgi:hypothetical protein
MPLPLEGRLGLVTPGLRNPQCVPGACEIELRDQVILVDSQDRLPTSAVILARDSKGRIYVSSRTKNNVLVFDSAGTVSGVIENAAASSTQRGQWRVGYFGLITRLLVGPDDTVFIGHLLGPSMMALGQDLQPLLPIRSAYIPNLVLADGTFLVARQIQTPDLVGFPLHVMDRQGRIIRSFGVDVPQYREDQKLQMERIVGTGRTGSIWAAAPGRYEFERWEPSRGDRLQKVQVKSSWFVPSSTMARAPERPNSVIVALWEKDSVLWVLTRIADAGWMPGPHRPGEQPHNDAQYDRTFDWVLEAIDPASSVILAHRRFETAMWTAAPHYLVTTPSPPGVVRRLVVSSAVLRAKEK